MVEVVGKTWILLLTLCPSFQPVKLDSLGPGIVVVQWILMTNDPIENGFKALMHDQLDMQL